MTAILVVFNGFTGGLGKHPEIWRFGPPIPQKPLSAKKNKTDLSHPTTLQKSTRCPENPLSKENLRVEGSENSKRKKNAIKKRRQ